MPRMTGAALLARARKYTDDLVAPYYTDDEDMYLYISEAERQLAVTGKLLRDVRRYKTKDNGRWLNLIDDPEIIEFKVAWLENEGGQRFRLELKGTMDPAPATRPYYDDYGATAATSALVKGRPLMMQFGKRTGYAELVPIPDGVYTVEASLVTYPANAITSATYPEIAERYHQHIPVGAALMALEAVKHEYAPQKIQNLEVAWNRALTRVQHESGEFNRDASTVHFSNDMWEGV